MKSDEAYIKHIQKNIAHVQRLMGSDKEVFLADEDKQAAILYYLQTLSESTTRISQTLRDAHTEIEWQKIRGFRNRIAHDYMSVDLELVWTIVKNELTLLQVAIQAMLETLEAEDD